MLSDPVVGGVRKRFPPTLPPGPERHWRAKDAPSAGCFGISAATVPRTDAITTDRIGSTVIGFITGDSPTFFSLCQGIIGSES